jgi:hypothetical protein
MEDIPYSGLLECMVVLKRRDEMVNIKITTGAGIEGAITSVPENHKKCNKRSF